MAGAGRIGPVSLNLRQFDILTPTFRDQQPGTRLACATRHGPTASPSNWTRAPPKAWLFSAGLVADQARVEFTRDGAVGESECCRMRRCAAIRSAHGDVVEAHGDHRRRISHDARWWRARSQRKQDLVRSPGICSGTAGRCWKRAPHDQRRGQDRRSAASLLERVEGERRVTGTQRHGGSSFTRVARKVLLKPRLHELPPPLDVPTGRRSPTTGCCNGYKWSDASRAQPRRRLTVRAQSGSSWRCTIETTWRSKRSLHLLRLHQRHKYGVRHTSRHFERVQWSRCRDLLAKVGQPLGQVARRSSVGVLL